MRTLDVIVGAQFGSEAKGHVTDRVLKRHLMTDVFGSILNARVGGPNAGHSVVDGSGRKWAFRHLPVGAVTPGVTCYIAPGSEIDVDVLLDEFTQVRDAGFPGGLIVSGEATIIGDENKAEEARLVGDIGSTGKGIGSTRADRAMRVAKRVIDDGAVMERLARAGIQVLSSKSESFALAYQHVVVEGTQGYGLGLHAGEYPFCTSGDCRAIDVLAQAGVNPWRTTDPDGFKVWLVVRPFPIRVAGNSGPLDMETTWEDLGLEEERTTVTNKVRRVGRLKLDRVRDAVTANGGLPYEDDPVRLVLTMADQIDPDVKGQDRWNLIVSSAGVAETIHKLEMGCGSRVAMITTSDRTGATK
jgi:adenylosuccinate synthase